MWLNLGYAVVTIIEVCCMLALGVMALFLVHGEIDKFFEFRARRRDGSPRPAPTAVSHVRRIDPPFDFEREC